MQIGQSYDSHNAGEITPKGSGDHLSIKMSSYQYTDPHVKDKTVSRPSCL